MTLYWYKCDFDLDQIQVFEIEAEATPRLYKFGWVSVPGLYREQISREVPYTQWTTSYAFYVTDHEDFDDAKNYFLHGWQDRYDKAMDEASISTAHLEALRRRYE